MAPKRPRGAPASFEAFIGSAETPAAVDAFLALSPRPPRNAAIHLQLIYAESDVNLAIERRSKHRYDAFQTINPRVPAYRVSSTFGRIREVTLTGSFAVLPASKPGLYRLLTVSYTPFWDRVLLRLARHLYPDATPVFFRQVEIRDALSHFHRSLLMNQLLRVSEATMKRKSPTDVPSHLRRFETDRLWTELSLSDLFSSASEKGQWFSSIQFVVDRQDPESGRLTRQITARIHKSGHLAYDSAHSEITANLLPTLEAYAADRLALLKGRGLRERNYRPGRPIQITFPDEALARPEDIRRFADVISRYPNSTRAVFHANPYYHASVADFLDGSSFEVWVLSSCRVILLPQARSSARAFQRLISHVFLEFREGAVSEYAE